MGNKSKNVVSLLLGIGMGIGLDRIIMKYCKREIKQPINTVISPIRFEVGFHLFNKWLKLKNEGRTFSQYFHDNEIATVAIYGIGALGERLFEELKSTDVKVLYAIDRIADSKHIEGLRIVGSEDVLDEVDVVIVTPVQDYDTIEENLERRTDADIVSLEDIIDYCV